MDFSLCGGQKAIDEPEISNGAMDEGTGSQHLINCGQVMQRVQEYSRAKDVRSGGGMGGMKDKEKKIEGTESWEAKEVSTDFGHGV